MHYLRHDGLYDTGEDENSLSRSCAIIVCDHGLGHVRRCALMAKKREELGERVTLFAPRASLERIQRAIPYTMGLAIHDFATHTTPERIRHGLPEAVEWVSRLPKLDDFETVICDNLPEILARRPDAIISAQFFWHDVIEGASLDYADYCEQLLAQHQPNVIGCELFAMETVRKQPGFKPVSLYRNPALVSQAKATPREFRTDLLVTGGSTPVVRQQLLRVINELLRKGSGPYKRVHVDPALMPVKAPAWMLKADFTVPMYCQLKAAMCRPGLGVVTDLMTVSARISPFYETDNFEMKHNASVISKLIVPNKLID